MARTKCSELRDAVVAKPGATERLAALRGETLEGIRLYELRHGEAISQAELAGRLDVTQGSDLQAGALRRRARLDASSVPGGVGPRLELVAVFDEDDRRVPVHLGKGSAA